jgi:hypothetical protein
MKARIELLKKDDDLAAGKQVLEKLMQCNSALYNGL